MNRPVPLSSTNNRAASTMLPANAHSHNAHKVNSSMTTTILDRIAAERHKVQEEDSKRHQAFRREATGISCKHRTSSSCDVSPPAYGVLHVPTLTKAYDRSSSSNTTATAPPPSDDGVTTAHNKSSTTGSIKLIQISSFASQQRRNSASNANERHFLVDHDERNDESSLPPSASTSPNMTPPKRRPHPNSLLSTAWGMASSRSVHDEMERIRLLMADMDSQSSSRPSQQRNPRRGSAFVSSSSSSSPPVSPTKLASRKTH